jgi:hypothetical protein
MDKISSHHMTTPAYESYHLGKEEDVKVSLRDHVILSGLNIAHGYFDSICISVG